MTASSLTLTTFRDRLETILQDSGNNIWATGTLDEAIKMALKEYSLVKPFNQITTLTLASDTRELDVSSVTGLLGVSRVWLPYTAADPEYPANERHFEFWRDNDVLYFVDDDEPQSGDVARLFYKTVQTLDGLDSETTTTFPVEDEETLLTGAAGHAALIRAIDMKEKVTLHRKSAEVVQAWGEARLDAFRVALNVLAGREALRGSAVVRVEPLDTWDRRRGHLGGKSWA